MLAFLGFLTVVLMLVLIMTKKHPPWWLSSPYPLSPELFPVSSS